MLRSVTAFFPVAAFGALLSAGMTSPVHAAPTRPVVVELFTSQSCSSCPPAGELFRDIASRDGVIALEWHVDYWNALRHGSAGAWRDPFSSSEHTDRQRQYNQALRGRRGVYTPQIIVNGVAETIGSRRTEVEALILSSARPEAIKILPSDETSVRFAAPAGAGVALFVTFIKSADTQVDAGENSGRRLTEANVVTNVVRLSPVAGAYVASLPPEGHGCALLIQPEDAGPVVAAAACP